MTANQDSSLACASPDGITSYRDWLRAKHRAWLDGDHSPISLTEYRARRGIETWRDRLSRAHFPEASPAGPVALPRGGSWRGWLRGLWP